MDKSVKWQATPTLPIVRSDDTLEVYIAPAIKAVPRDDQPGQIGVFATTTAEGTRTTQGYYNT
jgi:hypothetical protein